MHAYIKDIALNIQREREEKKKILNKVQCFLYAIKTKFWNIGKYKKSKKSCTLYYNDDESASANRKNIIVTIFFYPVCTFVNNKIRKTIGRLLKWIDIFSYIWTNITSVVRFQNEKNITKGKGQERIEEENEAIQNKLDRCILLDGTTDNISNRHIIQICKNYLSNVLFYIHNFGNNNGERNYKECKEITKMKKMYIHKVNNLKAFNSENNLYISDESLIKKIMIRDNSYPNYHYDKREMKETTNLSKIRDYEKQCVKTYYVENCTPLKSTNNRENSSVHYKNRHHLIFHVISNRLTNFYFFAFFTSFLLQQIPIFRASNYTYFALSFCFLFVFSVFKDIHTIAKRIQLERAVNEKTCKRVTPLGLVDVPFDEVKVGDVVYLEENEESPADLILLKCGTNKGDDDVYICSKDLEGKTDMKIKKSLVFTSHLANIYDLFRLKIKIMIEKPHKSFDKMNGLFIHMNYCEFIKSMYNDLASLQNVFYKNGPLQSVHYNDIFNYLIEDTYIEKAYQCVDFLIKFSFTPFENQPIDSTMIRNPHHASSLLHNGNAPPTEKAHRSVNSTNVDLANLVLATNLCREKQEKHYENGMNKFFSQNSQESVIESNVVKYKEKIGIENIIWCSNKIVKGRVYGLVAYAGSDKKTKVTMSKRKYIYDGDCNKKWGTIMNIWLVFLLIICFYLSLQHKTTLGVNIFISFIRYVLLLLPYMPYANILHIYLFSKISFHIERKKKMGNTISLLNSNIIDKICNTSFLLCDKNEMIIKEGLKICGVYFLFEDFQVPNSCSYLVDLMQGLRNDSRCDSSNQIRHEIINRTKVNHRDNLAYCKLFLQVFLNVTNFNPFSCPQTEGKMKNYNVLENIELIKHALDGKNKADKTQKVCQKIYSNILNQTTDQINKIYLTLLCILFCNVAVIREISYKKKKKKTNRTHHIQWDSIYSTSLEENVLINFVKSCGMDILKKNSSRISVGILTLTIKHDKKKKHMMENEDSNNRTKQYKQCRIKRKNKKDRYIVNSSDERTSDGRRAHRTKQNNYDQFGQKCWYFKNSLQNNGIFKLSNVAEKMDKGILKCNQFRVCDKEPNVPYTRVPSGASPKAGIRSSSSRRGSSGVRRCSSGRGRSGTKGVKINGRHDRCRATFGKNKGRRNKVKTYNFEILDGLSLDSNNQVICTMVSYNEKIFNLIKGPGEKIANMLSCEKSKKRLKTIFTPFYAEGFRIVLFAYREVSQSELEAYKKVSDKFYKKQFLKNSFRNKLNVLAIVTLKENIQKNAKKCLDLFKKAKIKTWILSGDNKENVISASKSLHLLNQKSHLCHLSRKKLAQMVHGKPTPPNGFSKIFVSDRISFCDFHLDQPYTSSGLAIRKKSLVRCGSGVQLGVPYKCDTKHSCDEKYTCEECTHMIKKNKYSEKFFLDQPNILDKRGNANWGNSPKISIQNSRNMNTSIIHREAYNNTCVNSVRGELGNTFDAYCTSRIGLAKYHGGTKVPENVQKSVKGKMKENVGNKISLHRNESIESALKTMLHQFSSAFKSVEKKKRLEIQCQKRNNTSQCYNKGTVDMQKNSLNYQKKENCVYIVRGDIIDYFIKYAKREFICALAESRCTLFYDCNSIQKGEITKCLRKNTGVEDRFICSVGNHAKDLNMLIESDIAISVNNNSKKNISNLYADIHIESFEDIGNVFFLYGYRIYENINSFIMISYYRGFAFLFLQFFFSYFFNSWLSMLSNICLLIFFSLFFIISIVTITISHNDETCMDHTGRTNYNFLQNNAMRMKSLQKKLFSLKWIFVVLWLSLYQSFILFIRIYYSNYNYNYEYYARQLDCLCVLDIQNKAYMLTPLFITHMLQTLFFLPTPRRNCYFNQYALLFIFTFLSYVVMLHILHRFHFVYLFKFIFTICIYITITLSVVNVPLVVYYAWKNFIKGSKISTFKHMKNSLQSLYSNSHQILYIGSLNSSLGGVSSFHKYEKKEKKKRVQKQN
ncbi:hypothetical protein, conserved [Plasmodium gonderi]|uniref:Aminophospholipid transporter n=1 Tax=Plasmodium gonderi TaxID=77519 RepID=A0A1Y1JIT1_PLAGO|nr:hypothetical protein, conserved [Plasmodium gonderi]GAW82399.1 hypothetical protein, conserved [Plasmodium gonderi]